MALIDVNGDTELTSVVVHDCLGDSGGSCNDFSARIAAGLTAEAIASSKTLAKS
jgi:hypothetical protein